MIKLKDKKIITVLYMHLSRPVDLVIDFASVQITIKRRENTTKNLIRP